MGVMIESNLVEGVYAFMMASYSSFMNLFAIAGRQDVPASGREGLEYGKSVTDGVFVHY